MYEVIYRRDDGRNITVVVNATTAAGAQAYARLADPEWSQTVRFARCEVGEVYFIREV